MSAQLLIPPGYIRASMHLRTRQMSLRIFMHLHKNINTVAMLTRDALLRRFRNGMYHGGNRYLCTLISYILLALVI